MPKRNERTLCVDFDGVIHRYIIGDWRNGVIYGDPYPGAIEGLVKLKGRGFTVVIHTTRASEPEQRDMIRRWVFEKAVERKVGFDLFEKWNNGGVVEDFPFLVTNEKVPAIAYIDDRAIRFVDWPDTLKYFG